MRTQSITLPLKPLDGDGDSQRERVVFLSPTRTFVRRMSACGGEARFLDSEGLGGRFLVASGRRLQLEFLGDPPGILDEQDFAKFTAGGDPSAGAGTWYDEILLKRVLSRLGDTRAGCKQLRADRRFFVAFDFITLSNTRRVSRSERAKLLESFFETEQVRPKDRTLIREMISLHERTLPIDVDLGALNLSFDLHLDDRLKSAAAGEVLKPMVEWAASSSPRSEFERAVEQTAELLFDLFQRLLPRKEEDLDLRLARSMLSFSDGRLRLTGESDLNCEPDGAMFFQLAEFALTALEIGAEASWEPELLEFWSTALAVFVESEWVYIRRYTGNDSNGRTRSRLGMRLQRELDPVDWADFVLKWKARESTFGGDPRKGYMELHSAHVLEALWDQTSLARVRAATGL